MNKKLAGIAFFAATMFASPAMAEVESWYTYWSIGAANNTYPDYIQDDVDAWKASPAIAHTEIAIDMFGFYWPMKNNQTLIGFVINGSADRFSVGNEYVQLNTYLTSLSAMHYFGNEPGDGFFIRGDLGLTKGIYATNSGTTSLGSNGTGALLGVGYGIAVSEDSRIILGLNLSSKTIGDEKYSTAAFSIGGLW